MLGSGEPWAGAAGCGSAGQFAAGSNQKGCQIILSERPHLSGIAIIGIALRFPGAENPAQFWKNICGKVESIQSFSDAELLASGVPAELLHHPQYIKAAPTITDVDKFDAAFFGYTPKEAALMDPQNRLFLEICAAAFDDAGYSPALLADRRVGVFAGGGGSLTSYLLAYANQPELRGQTAGLEHIGHDRDFLATRVSYKLNLTGPSMTVQTACSTSLVAVHLATQSLLNGECEMALAGASVVRIPQTSGHLAERGSVHSTDGHCRPFDANGSGTIFGSGVAAVLLKPLDAALADGDCIYAVIRSTVAANDGAEKVSYTASSSLGQAKAITEALALADIAPDTISYIECHATGTLAGDPVEIQALTRAFQLHTRRTGFCAVGSVKGNIGHPEQAAGLAGLIKAALALRHGILPPTAGFQTPNPKIDWENSPFHVQSEVKKWPTSEHPRRAGVNSLGIGGTNAFVLLEEAPRFECQPVAGPHPFCLSAKSPEALRDYVARFRSFVSADCAPALSDICHTVNVSRSAHKHRFGAVVQNVEDLRRSLDSFLASPGSGTNGPAASNIGFVFAGQGSQYAGMGRALQAFPAFRDAFAACASILDPALKVPLERLVFDLDRAGLPSLDQTRYTQPALFALEYSLAQLWMSWGVLPAVVMGHSLGEIVAACVADMYSLRDAALFVAARADQMQSLDAQGGMEACFASEEHVQAVLNPLPRELAVAAVNGPQSVVIAGRVDLLATARERLRAAGIQSRTLPVSHAFHSPLIDPMLPALDAAAAKLRPREPRFPVISNLTGRKIGQLPDAGYWCAHARNPVQFQHGVRAMYDLGCRTFVEIGPGATTIAMGKDCIADPDCRWFASLNRKKDGQETVLTSAVDLYLTGTSIDWAKVSRPECRRIPLPTYPFARKRHWISDSHPSPVPRADTVTPPDVTSTPEWSTAAAPYLADHRVYNLTVIPTTTVLLSVWQAASRHLGDAASLCIENLSYAQALVCRPNEEPDFSLTLTGFTNGSAEWRIASANAGAPLMTGAVRRAEHQPANRSERGQLYEGRETRFPHAVSKSDFYERLARRGLAYGPAFRHIQSVRVGQNEATVRVTCPPAWQSHTALFHPAMLDACLHSYFAVVEPLVEAESLPALLPVKIEKVAVFQKLPRSLWVHVAARDTSRDSSTCVVDIRIMDTRWRMMAEIVGLHLRRMSRTALLGGTAELGAEVLNVVWRVAEPATEQAAGRWMVVGANDADSTPTRVALLLRQRGIDVELMNLAGLETTASSFRTALESFRASRGKMDRILYVAPVDGVGPDDSGGVAEAEERLIRPALTLCQALLAADGFADCRLWIVTRGAQAIESGSEKVDPVQAELWGLGRTISVESPGIWGGLIDMPSSPGTAVEGLISAFLHLGAESQIAVRSGDTYVARLVKKPAKVRQTRVPIHPDATYLITGGVGMLGLKSAASLIEQGARHIVLVSRRARAPEARSEVARLRSKGAHIRLESVDLTDESQVASLLRTISREMPPLKGVLHGAGVLADGIFSQMSWEQFTRGTAPKAHGAWYLHRLTSELPLDFFVVQSSLLSLTGSSGQANYTAGNAFLDALVDLRIAAGLPAMALNWGPWAEAGMAASAGTRGEALWRRLGVSFIDPVEGTAAMRQMLLCNDEPHAAIVQCDWDQYASTLNGGQEFYSELTRTQTATTSLSDRFPADGLLPQLQRAIGEELGIAELLDADVRLEDLGVDSLMSVTLANRLERTLGVRIPLTNLLESPTIRELTLSLDRILGRQAATASAPASNGLSKSAAGSRTSVAVNDSRWLVIPRPNPSARTRLFCFNFAGGGASTYRQWPETLDPSIELVAVEPPGRASRIQEAPVRTLQALLDGVLPEMEPLLDRPAALLGHCLGGLNVYETARALLRKGVRPFHLFFSASRPPHRLLSYGLFEEDLFASLFRLPAFDPMKPLHQQPDDVFAQAIRKFNIGATSDFLAEAELRTALFPGIRADFETVFRYKHRPEPPWDIPITCFVGHNDPYVGRQDGMDWARYTTSSFQIHFRPSDHFLIAEDRDHIIAVVNAIMSHPEAGAAQLPQAAHPAPKATYATAGGYRSR